MSVPMPEPPGPPPGFKPPSPPAQQRQQYPTNHLPPNFHPNFPSTVPAQFPPPPSFPANFPSQFPGFADNQQQQHPQQYRQHSPPAPTFEEPLFIPQMEGYRSEAVSHEYAGRGLLEAKVPPDSFGLIGEILLCPFKVTLAILLALIHREER